MIDAPDTLHAYLLVKSELTDLVGTRIWPERTYPPKGYKPSDGAGVCFRARGGNPDYSSAMLFQSWQFKVYGATPNHAAETAEENAHSVYRVLVDVLHDGPHGAQNNSIRRSALELTGQTQQEQSGWVYVLCFFETWMRAAALV